jgi:esterase/lipase superfamily enzyme
MITNRRVSANSLSDTLGSTSFWVSDQYQPKPALESWKRASAKEFTTLLLAAAGEFPPVTDPALNENQKHVTLFIHGYNNTWEDSVVRYQSICEKLFPPKDGLGLCVLFTWPSEGSPVAYLPDRAEAEASAPALTDVLSQLYDVLLERQGAAPGSGKDCKAKTSVIAHSMGNYLFQRAMQYCWTRKNRPLLTSLVNQLLMVAADVDNDIFKSGETVGQGDGDAIANLSYRVTALYTGRDSVLGMSAGLKHFGKRRLGRSGLDRTYPIPDNVWDVDCSSLISASAENVHSAYFDDEGTIRLMNLVLRGVDRGLTGAPKPPPLNQLAQPSA